MSPTDAPRPLRSLGALGGPEGRLDLERARRPEELLDRLRQRLAELPDNHPSAARGSARDNRARASSDRTEPSESGEPGESLRRSDDPGSQERDSSSLPGSSGRRDPADRGEPSGGRESAEGLDQSEGLEQPEGLGPAESEADGTSDGAAEDSQETGDGQDAGDAEDAGDAAAKDARGPRGPSAGDGDSADLGLGLPGRAEVYRPWFMSGEQAPPWFAIGPGS